MQRLYCSKWFGSFAAEFNAAHFHTQNTKIRKSFSCELKFSIGNLCVIVVANLKLYTFLPHSLGGKLKNDFNWIYSSMMHTIQKCMHMLISHLGLTTFYTNIQCATDHLTRCQLLYLADECSSGCENSSFWMAWNTMAWKIFANSIYAMHCKKYSLRAKITEFH